MTILSQVTRGQIQYLIVDLRLEGVIHIKRKVRMNLYQYVGPAGPACIVSRNKVVIIIRFNKMTMGVCDCVQLGIDLLLSFDDI